VDSIVYFIDGGPPLKRAKKSKSKPGIQLASPRAPSRLLGQG